MMLSSLIQRLSLLSLIILSLASCTLDDELGSNKLSANDLTIEVLENPEEGKVMGQIQATADGALQFQMVSSDPIGAFTIEAGTGKLKAAMPEAFDFEQRSSVSAVVSVTSGPDIVEVNVLMTLKDVMAPIEEFNMLTKTWKTSKFSWSGDFASADNHSCRLDDIMAISGVGNYTYNGGNELCGNEDDQQLKTGTWLLDENLKYILFDKGTDNEFRATIDFLADGQLSLSGNYMGILVSGEYVLD